MSKPYQKSVKRLPTEAIGRGRGGVVGAWCTDAAVSPIAYQRVADRRHMYANLMRAAGL